jgi:hypothetical protein
LNNPLQKPHRKRSFKHWQREHLNSQWQGDIKLAESRWLITILDDHSHYMTGSQIFREGAAENVIWPFDRTVHEYTKPREILTDHNSGAYEEVNQASTLSVAWHQEKSRLDLSLLLGLLHMGYAVWSQYILEPK